MMDIYYENSRKEKLPLLKPPYCLQTGTIFDYSWTYVSNGKKISGFEKEIEERTLVLSILNYGKQEYYDAIDHFCEVTEYDVLNQTPGKLYVGNAYLQCYVIASEKAEWENDIELLDNTITVLTEYPFWISENTYNFFSYEEIASPSNKRYPGRYSYRYANGLSNAYIQNPHFVDANFLLRSYGPVVNPQISIGGVPYLVNIVLEDGEYIEIDSREEKVTKIMNDGTRVNAFHNRQKGRSFFQKIPPGRQSVVWPGTFDWDLVIYEERSEPKWSR